jgi:hypothetical protein
MAVLQVLSAWGRHGSGGQPALFRLYFHFSFPFVNDMLFSWQGKSVQTSWVQRFSFPSVPILESKKAKRITDAAGLEDPLCFIILSDWRLPFLLSLLL